MIGLRKVRVAMPFLEELLRAPRCATALGLPADARIVEIEAPDRRERFEVRGADGAREWRGQPPYLDFTFASAEWPVAPGPPKFLEVWYERACGQSTGAGRPIRSVAPPPQNGGAA